MTPAGLIFVRCVDCRLGQGSKRCASICTRGNKALHALLHLVPVFADGIAHVSEGVCLVANGIARFLRGFALLLMA
jgi:methyl coenzyme M reductase subunit C